MSNATSKLLSDVEAYLARNPGIAETTLGREAVNDGKVIGRLRAGGRCWPETEARLRQFMREHRFPVSRRKERAA